MNKLMRINARAIPILLSIMIFMNFFAPSAMTEPMDYNCWQGTIYIDSSNEFLEFAQNCSLDTYSKGKTFILNSDIDLYGKNFTSVPLFSGTFDGQGHTISGLSLKGNTSITGLFCYVLKGAEVRDLHVTGVVEPSGNQFNVGGIAGTNRGTIKNSSFNGAVHADNSVGGIAGINYGSIINCKSRGVISSKQCTGGIAGQNFGTISGCTNNASINTLAHDEETDLTQLESTLLDPKHSENTSSDTSDAGGIVGFSTGDIISCINLGTIGYDHVGYNVGGIAGRSQGYMRACYNTGTIKGRKDIGGISGQMEPLFYLQYLENNIGKMKEELDTLNSLVSDTIDSASYTASVASNGLESSITHLDQAQSAAATMADELGNWINSVSRSLNSGSWDIENGVVPDIPQLSGNYKSSAAQMESAINSLNTELNALMDELSGATGQLANNIKEVSDQQNVINHLSADIEQETQSLINDLDDKETSVIYSDISEENIFTSGPGHVLYCYNSGNITGDINTGGIVGAMAVDSDLDPEDDITKNGEMTSSFQYQSIAVVRNCTNNGVITTKKNCSGGIVGRMDTGTVYNCNGYGSVQSDTGDYVGGIAGYSASNVRRCNAKCYLQGLKYIGGIVGSGGIISDCKAMVKIASYDQFAGAISGDVEGEFTNNYFTSTDGEEGIDRFSYSNQAEPIPYNDLISLKDTPLEFKKFKLTFIVDNKVVDTIMFNYGDSIDAESIPEVLENDDYYGYWSRDNYDNLHFDDTVELIYTRYIAELTSTQCRENGRPIMMIDGRFKDDATMTIAENDTSLFNVNNVIEYWSLEFTNDDTDTHIVRYLPPTENEDIEIRLLTDDKWQEVPTSTMGSYYLFETDNNSAEIAIISKNNHTLIYVLIVLVLIIVIVLLFLKINKSKHLP